MLCLVVLVANSLPAVNDVTATELPSLVAAAAKHCDLLRKAAEVGGLLWDAMSVDSEDGPEISRQNNSVQPLMVAENGCGSPCLDFRQVSSELSELAKDADLIILEGMGRALHTNYNAKFTCECLKQQQNEATDLERDNRDIEVARSDGSARFLRRRTTERAQRRAQRTERGRRREKDQSDTSRRSRRNESAKVHDRYQSRRGTELDSDTGTRTDGSDQSRWRMNTRGSRKIINKPIKMVKKAAAEVGSSLGKELVKPKAAIKPLSNFSFTPVEKKLLKVWGLEKLEEASRLPLDEALIKQAATSFNQNTYTACMKGSNI
ncbi:hypothetical protein L7F22_012068 [Adiantum nelumboides]|nr:hypothetical protein [Adiantum nelumboides]